MKPFSKFAAILVALAASPLFADQSPTPSPTPAAEKTEASGGEFDIPVPSGMPVRGIKIPHRDENGKLLMMLEADVAQKLDETRIEMHNLKIDAFDEDGKKILVTIPHSIFHLDTRILEGERNASIQREDFEILGDSLEFNTRTRNGTVRGNVKMTILTADQQP